MIRLWLCFLLLSGQPVFAQETLCVRDLDAPSYPELARQAQVEGVVTVSVAIGSDGRATSSEISGPSTYVGTPRALLAEEAQSNIKTWTFSSGEPRKVEVTYEFRLEQPKVRTMPQARIHFDLPNHVVITSHASIPIHDEVVLKPKKK